MFHSVWLLRNLEKSNIFGNNWALLGGNDKIFFCGVPDFLYSRVLTADGYQASFIYRRTHNRVGTILTYARYRRFLTYTLETYSPIFWKAVAVTYINLSLPTFLFGNLYWIALPSLRICSCTSARLLLQYFYQQTSSAQIHEGRYSTSLALFLRKMSAVPGSSTNLRSRNVCESNYTSAEK